MIEQGAKVNEFELCTMQELKNQEGVVAGWWKGRAGKRGEIMYYVYQRVDHLVRHIGVTPYKKFPVPRSFVRMRFPCGAKICGED